VTSDPYAAAAGAHCLVVCTEWPEYAALDLARLRDLMALPIIVDGRNVLDPAAAAEAGFTYLPTGRPARGVGR
jgi:UDPglucose 6-dehydrogenase